MADEPVVKVGVGPRRVHGVLGAVVVVRHLRSERLASEVVRERLAELLGVRRGVGRRDELVRNQPVALP